MEADMSEFINQGAVRFHLSGSEIRVVARRQLVASVAVAIVVALGLGVTALLPASHNDAAVAPQRVAAVQQSKFAIPAEHAAAAMQYAIEAP
jgi:hypothetical protein